MLQESTLKGQYSRRTSQNSFVKTLLLNVCIYIVVLLSVFLSVVDRAVCFLSEALARNELNFTPSVRVLFLAMKDHATSAGRLMNLSDPRVLVDVPSDRAS